MRRPGPLQELPLERFLTSNPNLPPSTPFKANRPNKRPLSPGAPILYSPAKRRILEDEGIFSPERTMKSPLSSSRGSASRAGISASFTDILQGCESPARKLDFGLPKNHHVDRSSLPQIARMSVDSTPPRPSTSSRSLAPSPGFSSKQTPSLPSSSSSTAVEMDDYFSPKNPSSSTRTAAPLTVIPRDLPPPPDPQSAHYPGFFVHWDTHITLYSPHTTTGPTPELDMDKDAAKENQPIRRKARKAVSAPITSNLESQLLSPAPKRREIEKFGKGKSIPGTPKNGSSGLPSLTPTPRRPVVELTRTSAATPRLLKNERLERRRMLEDEVDDAEGEEEGGMDLF